jgi:hypothetical protein
MWNQVQLFSFLASQRGAQHKIEFFQGGLNEEPLMKELHIKV